MTKAIAIIAENKIEIFISTAITQINFLSFEIVSQALAGNRLLTVPNCC